MSKFDPKSPKGSVPNGQSKFLMRYAIRWFKCKLKPPKKKVHLSYIFLHLSANFWLKIQNSHRHRNWGTFLTSGQSALNGPPSSPMVIWSKIQNRLSTYGPMDRFLMHNLNNKCPLTPHEWAKKVVLDFQRPVVPP